VFVVKDRMNKKYNNRVDVWFDDTQKAIDFGVKTTYIEVF
jgi:3D (Asp-Asp-Asp) domain-containing protein